MSSFIPELDQCDPELDNLIDPRRGIDEESSSDEDEYFPVDGTPRVYQVPAATDEGMDSRMIIGITAGVVGAFAIGLAIGSAINFIHELIVFF